MSEPRVSVIVPCYNMQAYLGQAIQSVQAQTFSGWELLLIDDASTDGTRGLIQEAARGDHRIRPILLEKNSGVARARNEGVHRARGQYLAFLDSDDAWCPEKLEAQLALMSRTAAVLSYTAYLKMTDEGRVRGTISVQETLSYADLLRTNSIGCSTAIYDSAPLGKRYFNETIGTNEDYLLWLSILKQGNLARGINRPLACYRARTTSRSSNKLRTMRDQLRIYRRFEHLSWLRCGLYFASYAYHGVKKSLV